MSEIEQEPLRMPRGPWWDDAVKALSATVPPDGRQLVEAFLDAAWSEYHGSAGFSPVAILLASTTWFGGEANGRHPRYPEAVVATDKAARAIGFALRYARPDQDPCGTGWFASSAGTLAERLGVSEHLAGDMLRYAALCREGGRFGRRSAVAVGVLWKARDLTLGRALWEQSAAGVRRYLRDGAGRLADSEEAPGRIDPFPRYAALVFREAHRVLVDVEQAAGVA